MKRIKFLFLAVCLISMNAAAQNSKPTVGPLQTITHSDFLKLSLEDQGLFVGGVLAGLTLTTYNYGLPDHDIFAKCMASMPLNDFTKKVVATIKAHPEFKEGVATSVTMTAAQTCKEFRRKK